MSDQLSIHREFVRLAESEPLVLSVSPLSDFLWEDFVRDTRPTVKYLTDHYNIRQLSRFGKELFDYLYNGSAVTPLVSLDEVETYFRAQQDGESPSMPKGYKPESAFWVGLFADICDAPAWPQIVRRCVGDQFNSGNNAISILNELCETISQEIDAERFPTELLAEGAEQLQQIREEYLQAKKDGDNAKAAELRQKGKELGKQIEQALQKSRMEIQPQTPTLVEKAKRKAEETEKAISALAGSEAGHGEKGLDLEAKRKLAEKLARNPKLRSLAAKLGALRRAWAEQKRARRSNAAYSDIVGAKFSDAITQAFPSEIALAGTEQGRALFLMKYAQKTLLTKDYEAHIKNLEKGPVVMYIDISGSMAGDSEIWSKAIAFVISEECLKEGREVQVHLFDTEIQESITLKPKCKENPSLIEFVMAWITKGGTSFSAVINHALTKAHIDEKADILLITDGHSQVPDAFIKRLAVFKQEKGVHWNSFCIGEASSVLTSFSDSVQVVDTSNDPEASELFQTILK